jgi:tetratricopeptide (TPR) repeat protein
MGRHINTAESVLLEALRRPAGERERFVETACADDPDLRRRVEEGLQAHQEAETGRNGTAETLESATERDGPAEFPTEVCQRSKSDSDYASPDAIVEGPGKQISHYQLVQEIGEGGMGAVYLAEQQEPVRRQVALKIIKPGMDSRQVIARFEAERQALAMMDHQNIARVLDAGTTETGRPYFVMDLVRGMPITEYCDENRLTLRERLGLFIADQPLVEAGIRLTIGGAYHALGENVLAETHLTRAFELRNRHLGQSNEASLEALNLLADLYIDLEKYEEAGQWLRRVLEVGEETLGEEHPVLISATVSLARLHRRQNDHQSAEKLLDRAVEVSRRSYGIEHPCNLAATGDLAMLYLSMKKLVEAEELQSQVVQLQRQLAGDGHPTTLLAMMNLAMIYGEQYKHAEAEQAIAAVLEHLPKLLGPDHPTTQNVERNLAWWYSEQGKFEEVENLIAEIQERVGAEHLHTLLTMQIASDMYRRYAKFARAVEIQGEVIRISQRMLGETHPSTLDAMEWQAKILAAQGVAERDKSPMAEAEELRRSVLELRRESQGPEHPDTLNAMRRLATTLRLEEKFPEAELLLAEAVERHRRVLGAENYETILVENVLGLTFYDQGKLAEAKQLYLDLLDTIRNALGSRHRLMGPTLANYANVLIARGEFAEAEAACREELELSLARKASQSAAYYGPFVVMSRLGGILAKQGKYAEAESMLLEAYEGFTAREDSIPDLYRDRITDSVQRTISLYGVWDKPDQVQAWQKKLETIESGEKIPRAEVGTN